MATNTYLPFIGGVERSLEIFAREFRKKGNRVLIVAPEYENNPANEIDVIRVPSLTRFNGTDFSVQLPVPGVLHTALKDFTPDIVHAHHPFMLGDTALRIAAQYCVPIVFTHHTFYEKYTHYINEHSDKLKAFVARLATEYANLCNLVFAPSASVARELMRRGVKTKIRILPTGIDINAFQTGNGREFRKEYHIDEKTVIVGFVSRIAPEKNPEFLIDVVKDFLILHKNVHFLVVGKGPSEQKMVNVLKDSCVLNRCTLTGVLSGDRLVNAYHAMDVFAFASQTETQGLVVIESMASGVPVIAVDGPGIREIVSDYHNGRLVSLSKYEFYSALEWFLTLENHMVKKLRENAVTTAMHYSKEYCTEIALDTYASLLTKEQYHSKVKIDTFWKKTKRILKAEYELLKIMTKATGAAINTEKRYKK